MCGGPNAPTEGDQRATETHHCIIASPEQRCTRPTRLDCERSRTDGCPSGCGDGHRRHPNSVPSAHATVLDPCAQSPRCCIIRSHINNSEVSASFSQQSACPEQWLEAWHASHLSSHSIRLCTLRPAHSTQTSTGSYSQAETQVTAAAEAIKATAAITSTPAAGTEAKAASSAATGYCD